MADEKHLVPHGRSMTTRLRPGRPNFLVILPLVSRPTRGGLFRASTYCAAKGATLAEQSLRNRCRRIFQLWSACRSVASVWSERTPVERCGLAASFRCRRCNVQPCRSDGVAIRMLWPVGGGIWFASINRGAAAAFIAGRMMR